jgi:ribosomal-protein-alanine N-acetyltransferase
MTILLTPRTRIRHANETDAAALWRFRMENREHLAPWEPLREERYYTLGHSAQTIADWREAIRLDRGYAFLVLGHDEREVIGTFNLANLVRGVFQACHLGYAVAQRWQGQGLMREALESGLAWAFGPLGLHRVMANYMPRNERSGRLLERLGFEREGYAKRYLCIGGEWEDHVLTALIHPRG